MFLYKSLTVLAAVLIFFTFTNCQDVHSQPEWNIKVSSLVVDNCPASGCSCLTGGPPHHGTCRAVGVMHISEGNYGDVSLAGQNFGMTVQFTSMDDIHYMSYYIDENASPEVKKALRELLSNAPFGIIGDGYEIKETAIKYSNEKGGIATFALGDYGNMTLTPMLGGDGKTQMSVVNPTYPFPAKEIFLSSAKGHYEDYGKEINLTDNSGEVGEFELSGGGK